MKKGQITLFIIIGLIALMIIGLFLYITRERAVKPLEITRPKLVEVPEAVKPVNEFVLTCLSQLLKDGIKKIGDHGGWVDVKNLNFYPMFPTKGNAVQFSPDSELITAYWWYMSSEDACKGNCRFETKRPPLHREEGVASIESQLDDYIAEKLEDCLDGFRAFADLGFTVTPKARPKVQTTIAENDVFATLEYPLHITRGDVSYDIKDFVAEHDVRLKEIYELATTLANIQIENNYLEQVALMLIDVFSATDSKMLPPMSDLDITLSAGKFWVKHKVKENLKQIIQAYTPFIQVWGVRNYRYVFSPPETRDKKFFEVAYNRQFFWPLNTTHPELEARFQYLDWWEPYFDLNCRGELCTADEFAMHFPMSLGMKRYDFFYDLSYPVLVEISQPSAFKEEGYSFKYFIEVNIRNNQPFTTGTKLVSTGRPEVMLFCNPNQYTSGNVSILVQDGITGLGVDEASITFACGNAQCDLGLTDKGNFVSQFPRCVGGLLTVRKPGYASTTTDLDTDTEEEKKLTLTLEPHRIVDFSIKQWYLTKASKRAQWKLDQNLGLLGPRAKQSTIIMLTRKTDPYTEPFVAFAEISPDTPDESKNIAIIPGKYEVKITTLLYENITIPVDERCEKYPTWLGKKKKKCYWVPENPIEFSEENPFLYGGAEFEWELTPTELLGAKEIEFRQIVLGLDRLPQEQRIVEDLSEMGKIEAYSKAYDYLLTPRVIK